MPNYPYIHARTEIVSTTEWKVVGTIDKACVFWNVHINHTGNGEGVLLAYSDLGQGSDNKAMGPYFGDSLPVVPGVTVPTTDIQRRVRVNHIYAKLDANFWVPTQGDPRQNGPTIVVEEYSMFQRQGSTREKQIVPEEASTEAFLRGVGAEQAQVKREMDGGSGGLS